MYTEPPACSESAILKYKCCRVPEFLVRFFSHEAITFGDEDKNRTSDQPVKNSELLCLSGLTGPAAFDTVGEPATLSQRWRIWKDEFELFVTASGIDDPKQQRALLLHLAGPGVREIFRTIPEETKGDAKDFKKAMELLTDYFKLKNILMARQNFLAAAPTPGERIHNFVTRLSSLAEHCEYGEEKDNMTRDQVLTYIKDKNLKSKLYRTENLTLSKLLDVVSQHHDKEALILQPEEQIN